MTNRFFFGYGSLVNRATHDYPEAHPATIRGWRRAWRHTTAREVAFLTVVEDPTSEIDGLIASVASQAWDGLDHRERAYDRVPVADVAHPVTREIEIVLYSIPAGHHAPPRGEHGVLLSYLDTVVQGFLREFGEEGVERFFETTEGWDAPILNDRNGPRYSRAQALTSAEIALVDHHLARLGAVLKTH